MRILRIFYDWPGKWDGLAPAGYEVTKEQVKQGHKVTVMCGYWRSNPPELLDNVNIISTFREPAHGWLFFTSSIILFFKYFLWRNKYKVDVIHSHGHFAIWIYLYRKIIKNIPFLKNFEYEPAFVVHFHNTFKGRWESLKAEGKTISKMSEKIFYPLGVLSDKWSLEVCDKAIFVAENLLEEAVKFYNADRSKCVVIESGVNTELFKRVSQIERQKTRAELGFDEFDKVIINYGKMVARKNIVALIKSISLLPINYKLILIGEGPKDYQTEIMNAIADGQLSRRVKTFGYADYRQISVPLQAADVFVLPSDFEGLPKAILEALSTEMPVVYSGFDFKEPILGAFKLKEKTPQAIAEAVFEITQKQPIMDIEKFRITYSWKSKAYAMQKIYEEILNKKS
jgi:glycosyltransferase involved in cell wall biosynthesis